MKNRTALVFGGTGLIGRHVINDLLKSDDYEVIKIFTRRETSYPETSKIQVYVVDFDNPESFSGQLTGDDLFICLGTTIKKAGSVSKMEQIDRDLPVTLARSARGNKVKRIAVDSSTGANRNSSNYYLRIKGEMEQGIMNLDFETTAIVRPSLLLGDRGERRPGEQAAKAVMKLLGTFLAGRLKKYRGIEGSDVAKAMISILKMGQGKEIFESDRLQKIADQRQVVLTLFASQHCHTPLR
ncbi:MAG: hypothetical protein A2X05_09175 [Bacteroidetes bacterium GWE2_41_25]|nr:MAG: hypothetical protein A2X03_04880 [Bacteroidetes bacterium GWA2_40_15]OFX84889.1 MAG: hypothetical protein A2X06_14570 [Bacteroidetes bacterium GWC2_40_22]OFY05446.1 MAG: hypothetical protein A2X05_09175 [Bacteroidetes bacterium GWE2_41_25]OFY57307.1 MAG: hypothetical protein A2X04_12455 [Bacteroidetes bacterium GWF2_41_9]HBH84862.1 oxidoreductase [Bacteroidales bacterium]